MYIYVLWRAAQAKNKKQASIREELGRPVPGSTKEGGWRSGEDAEQTSAAKEKGTEYPGPATGPKVSGPAGKPISLIALVLLFFPIVLLAKWAEYGNTSVGTFDFI